nr:immunoglobulin light chain junction region [Macaca mulatta]MOW11107.1 immunoglobulin light chain junction region [Macaca mulatta]
CQKYKTSPFTF